MLLRFLGVGEACDPDFSNTSLLLQDSEVSNTVMLDCGFTAAHSFFASKLRADDLSAVWISHFHGDHFFGLPLVLLRLKEMGRSKSLYILGQDGVEEKVKAAMDLAYPGHLKKLNYKVEFVNINPRKRLDFLGWDWKFAWSEHSVSNLALRISRNQRSIYYSGDGGPGRECHALAQGVDLLVQECFAWDRKVTGHFDFKSCLEFFARSKAKKMALVHMQRQERRNKPKEFIKKLNEMEKVFLPEPGYELEV